MQLTKEIEASDDVYDVVLCKAFDNPYELFPFVMILGTTKYMHYIVRIFEELHSDYIAQTIKRSTYYELILINNRRLIIICVYNEPVLNDLKIYDYYPQDLEYFDIKDILESNKVCKSLYVKMKAKK